MKTAANHGNNKNIDFLTHSRCSAVVSSWLTHVPQCSVELKHTLIAWGQADKNYNYISSPFFTSFCFHVTLVRSNGWDVTLFSVRTLLLVILSEINHYSEDYRLNLHVTCSSAWLHINLEQSYFSIIYTIIECIHIFKLASIFIF